MVSDIGGTTYPSDPAFQVTLTNSGGATADVDGMAVVFFDASGTETGSVQAQSADSFIVPGQSLTWTYRDSVTPAGTGTGSGGGQVDGIPAGAATGRLVQWYHP